MSEEQEKQLEVNEEPTPEEANLEADQDKPQENQNKESQSEEDQVVKSNAENEEGKDQV